MMCALWNLQQQIAVIKRGGCGNSIALDLQLKKHYSRYEQHKNYKTKKHSYLPSFPYFWQNQI